MHLSYADPLEGLEGMIDIKGKKSVVVAEEFLELVNPYEKEVRERDSLEYFISRISKSGSYRNTRIGYDYGLALILSSQYDEAIQQLDKVANSDWEKRVVPEEANSASELAQLLRNDPQEAVKIVNNYCANSTSDLEKYLGANDQG